MDKALSGEAWEALRDKLLEFVTNFEYRVVQAAGGFQM
jgi:hypothetical protein